MKSTILKKNKVDFEELGYQTMVETGNEEITKEICALRLHAFADELKPELLRLSSDIEQKKGRRQSLWSHLYDRQVPASDAKILSLAITAGILAVLVVVALVASVGSNAMTFYLFGLGLPISLVFGVGLTGIAIASGYQAYEKILRRHWLAEGVVILAAFALFFWGVLQMAQARGTMMEKLATSTSAKSFVDGNL